MNRTALNAAVDALAYAGFVALAATGLMLRYQMPPGSGGLHGMGAGSGAGAGSRPVTIVWGLSRHEWGGVHYWIAIGLMAVLAVHLLLHWKWIVCVLRGKPHAQTSGGRFALGVAGLVLVTLLAAAPLLTPAQTTRRSEALPSPSGQQHAAPNAASAEESTSEATALRGFMTLQEAAELSGVPVEEILSRLGLPPDTSPREQVGRLLRAHGLDMGQLREAIGQEEPSH
ncbi:MAG TPA: DUF4405 domain-containing protein [Lacipirellulaceae bacterium]|nr:DUF4405 domain-containing protein [Lacipirellulaceae bacterium]HMP05475.1 DUF4405 domain-containing protein [Lacipirellulaceae bacterium]